MFSVGEHGNFKMRAGRWNASAGDLSHSYYIQYIYTVFQCVHHALKCVTCGYKSHLKYVKMSIKNVYDYTVCNNVHVSTICQNMDKSHILWISHI